jgi:hypothetical protein
MSDAAQEVVFADDFTDAELHHGQREQHMPDGYQDFVVRDGRIGTGTASASLIRLCPASKPEALLPPEPLYETCSNLL